MPADAQPQAARTGDAVQGDLVPPATRVLWDQNPQAVCMQTPASVEFGLGGMEIHKLLRGRPSRLLPSLYSICHWKETEGDNMWGEVEAARHQPKSSRRGQTVSCRLLPDLSYCKPRLRVSPLVSSLPVSSSPSMHRPLPHIKLCPNEPQTNLIELETSLHQR